MNYTYKDINILKNNVSLAKNKLNKSREDTVNNIKEFILAQKEKNKYVRAIKMQAKPFIKNFLNEIKYDGDLNKGLNIPENNIIRYTLYYYIKEYFGFTFNAIGLEFGKSGACCYEGHKVYKKALENNNKTITQYSKFAISLLEKIKL